MDRIRPSASSFAFAHKRARFRVHGFSLVELMVGLLISLIGTLAMMIAFANFEGAKRTTTSGSDAQQAGSFSLFNLERQIRTAGSGFVQGKYHGVWGCPISAYSSGAQRLPVTGALPKPFDTPTLHLPLTMRMIPALIASGGSAGGYDNPDALVVMGGNPAIRTFRAGIAGTPAPTATSIVLQNPSTPPGSYDAVGVSPGDYLLGASDMQWPYTAAPGTCVLTKATAVNTTTGVVTLSAPDGPPTGFVGAFAGQAYTFDLGPSPLFTLFGIDTTTQSLVSYDLLQRDASVGAAPVPMADGIVALKAVYGVSIGDGKCDPSVPADGAIDNWFAPTLGTTWGIDKLTNGTPASATAICQIKAIRLAVVSRSQLQERASDYTNPYSSTNPLTLFPDLSGNGIAFKVSTQPQYRYKVFDITIPIRNWSISTFR